MHKLHTVANSRVGAVLCKLGFITVQLDVLLLSNRLWRRSKQLQRKIGDIARSNQIQYLCIFVAP